MQALLFWNLFGGMALILFGIRQSQRGFQKLGGPHLRAVLSTLTSSRLKSGGAGFLLTIMTQSSMATALLLISFISTQLIRLPEAIAFILGADIGTTITVQLLAFRVADYAVAVVGVGVFLFLFAKTRAMQGAGQGILGFGLVFLALKLVGDATAPLKDSEAMRTFITLLSGSPLTCMLASAALTVVLQHSAATLGIALAMASQGLLPIPQALPIVLGANIGTTVLPLIASAGYLEARRMTTVNLALKCMGALVVLFFLSPLSRWMALTTDDPVRQIANAHTLFNVVLGVVSLPFTPWLATIATRFMTQRKSGEPPFGPKYLQPGLVGSPPLALGQAARETLHMGDIAASMLRDSIQVFAHDDEKLRSEIQDRDDRVDLLDREIKLYLTRLSTAGLTPEEGRRKMAILGFVYELENIGDIVDRSLMELARKKINNVSHFSKEGWAEIQDFHARVLANMEMALTAFANRDKELARRLLHHKEQINELERALRQTHIDRLQAGVRESIETTSIHLDVLSNLRRINSHLTAAAYPILENSQA